MKKLKFLLFVLTIFFISCEKDKFEGPMLDNPNLEFAILEPLDILGSTDFSNNQNTYFKTSFSKQVDWKIKIKGLNSGSIKNISGKSDFIDQSNSLWDGSSTKIPFFIGEEDCLVELSFEIYDTIIETVINIQSPKLYDGDNTILITDFESGFNPNFTGFFQAGCTKALSIGGGAGQGVNFLQQFGTCDWDWLIGYVDYYSTYWWNQDDLVNDPAEVYFNIMINGDSTISQTSNVPNSLFKLEFYEDENGDGYYDANTEDRYDYEFDVNWNGWKMVSICYNDEDKLVLATNGGDGVRNPSKISNVRTLLLANPDSGPAKADVDFLIWSIGSPILN